MNPHLILNAAAVTAIITAAASVGPTILYVSESGETGSHPIAWMKPRANSSAPEPWICRGAPGSLAIYPKRARLYAAVRSVKRFVTLTIDPATGLLSSPVFGLAGIDTTYVQVDKTGKWPVAASYADGVVTVNRITDGVLTGAPIQTLETGMKAHCVQFAPGNALAAVASRRRRLTLLECATIQIREP